MRTLIYVPVIHTSADLGSLGKDVAKRGIADIGEGIWEKHKAVVEKLWDCLSGYFDSIDVSGMKVYQDGMVADGEVGQKIVEEGAKSGSRSCSITGDIRVVYRKKDEKTVILLDIGTHNQVYGK